jgi:transposase
LNKTLYDPDRLVQGNIERQRDTRLHPWPKAAEEIGEVRQATLQTSQPIEIMFGRLKDWRRVATRYDRCPKVFLSAIALAALVIYWL